MLYLECTILYRISTYMAFERVACLCEFVYFGKKPRFKSLLNLSFRQKSFGQKTN